MALIRRDPSTNPVGGKVYGSQKLVLIMMVWQQQVGQSQEQSQAQERQLHGLQMGF